MAYTYLEAVNEILGDSNEVELTSSNFSTAVGIHKVAKNYINKAYMEIVGKEVQWPFLAATESNTFEPYSGNVNLETVAGTRWYLLKTGSTDITTDYGKVDWESFYLTTEGATGATTPYEHDNLIYTPYDEWAEHLRERENKDAGEDQTYGQPDRVIPSKDGRYFGLSAIPDGVYDIYFTAWLRATKLSAYTDTIIIPDEYVPVLLNRANYFLLKWKKDYQEATLANRDYDKGIREMYRALIGNPNNYMRDDRINC